MTIKEQIYAEIERRYADTRDYRCEDWIDKREYKHGMHDAYKELLEILDSIPEQPVSDHHEIEVEFRGEKVTINREFYRDGEMNYSTSEQDDNAIWSALRAWCEKKGITPFELYPKQQEQPVKGLEEEISRTYHDGSVADTSDLDHNTYENIARHFAAWGAEHLKR